MERKTKCPVCHKNTYRVTKGIKEQNYDGDWIVTQPNSGFCPNCRFHFKGGDKDSFEGQVKEYKKIYFMRRIASKKNGKEVIL